MRKPSEFAYPVLMVLWVMVHAGCHSAGTRVKAEGVVTYLGNPVEAATVTMRN